ncbi:CRISPR-associated endonuclease Cas1 [Fontisphaera persica]|uniref:CRISPR-associated endonuclease Cas1 n=1 Tax=Fontisphaera persica TaxID=2974023 RepID=UPI0024C01363|nr:CRISPR-associated endonuclease Cas1 [Fontisphaera persica]WCJ60666.1 CRISPR-associated endonuclease Cas1 [Fontisphaera persica]
MPTAYITTPQGRVRLARERLEIVARNGNGNGHEEVIREIPIRDLDRVLLEESVQITSEAMAELLRRAVPVGYLGWNGQFLGGFLPPTQAHGMARLRQYQRTLEPEFALQMARKVVTAKLYNQRRVLQRIAASRSGREGEGVPLPDKGQVEDFVEMLEWLHGLFEDIKKAGTLDELRGYEGVSTARYWQMWGRLLPPEFPFERRSTRPPHNAVNACISFGATMIYHEMVAFLHGHGLDPSLGLLHHTEDGRWSLALDLIEPFRPALVEALTLDLFTHQMLGKEHFEPKNGGIYLNAEGRRKYLLQYERRMERQFMSECVGHRTTLRQQLEQQAVMYKAALEQPDRFEPFIMN